MNTHRLPTPQGGNLFITGTLPCDHALSMELYVRHLERALPEVAGETGWRTSTLLPAQADTAGRFAKQFLRYRAFPACVRETMKSAQGPSVLHVTDHSNGHLCRAARPSIATVHDLTHFEGKFLPPLQHQLWHWRVRGLKSASHLAAVSAHVARGIETHLGVPRSRIHVVHNGISDAFSIAPQFSSSAAQHCKNLPTGLFKVLHVGTNQERKNLPTLLRAIAELKQSGIPVVLLKAGPRLEAEPSLAALLEDLGLRKELVELGPLSQADLNEVYRLVDAVSFPSTVEGFGWPAVEAQICQTPVVLADNSCLREVGGEGALFHENFDHRQLASHLQSLSQKPELRSQLIEKGVENCKRFSWKTHARLLLDLATRAWEEHLAATRPQSKFR